MAPVTRIAVQRVADLLTTGNALGQQISNLAAANGSEIPTISSDQVIVSSAPVAMGDLNAQFTYPRVCLYASAVKNQQIEKFRSLSGTISVVGEVWASANLLQDADEWIHFYVEAFTIILRQNIGDWGQGMFFSGMYDVQFQPPKAGGLGYIESAKVTSDVNISLN